jgi:O-antigen ligase
MKSSKQNNKHQHKYYLLFGLIFLSPILFSTHLLEMDNLQKLTLFFLAIPFFIYSVRNIKSKDNILVSKYLFVLLILFPSTFFIAFSNGSADMLLLQFTFLIPPIFITLLTLFALYKIGEEKLFKISSFSVVITSTIFSFIGLLQVMNVELLPLPQIIIPGSTIGHRGFAAEYLLPAIPFLLILKNYIKRDYYSLLFFAGIINISFLFFTRSRSALGISLLILAVLIIYLLFKKEYKNKVKTIAPIAAVFIISFLISLIPPVKGERSDFRSNVTSIVDSENRSNKMRMNFWDASLQMIKENPITGVGLQKWSGIYPKYYGNEFVDSQIYFVHAIHAHNDFLELFAENGVATPIIYAIIILMIIINLFRKGRLNENYFFILISALVTIGFSFIAFPISKFSSYFFLAFAAGLALQSLNIKSDGIQLSAKYIKYLLVFLVLIGVYTSYERLNSELSYIKAIEYKNGGNFKSMQSELEKINSVLYPFDPSKQPIEFYISTALYRLGKLDEALIHSINAEKISLYNPLVLHNTGAIYQSQKKYDKAIIYYKKMQKLFPNYIDPQVNLLIIYSETASFEKGKQLFNELIKKDPLNPRLTAFKAKFSG